MDGRVLARQKERLVAQALAAELKELDAALEQLTTQFAPHLREQFGVGSQTAAMLSAVAGEHPERLRSKAALAARCGVNPLPASSGKTIRHRLNRGDRSNFLT